MKKVVIFSDYYLPGYHAGGPIPSISRIVDIATECDFRVVTRNHDLGQSKPYMGFSFRTPKRVGRAEVYYLGKGMASWFWMVRSMRRWKPEAYYFNSVYSAYSTLLPITLIRLRILPKTKLMLIAPRGELSVGAQSLKSFKKTIFNPWLRLLIGRGITWHASTEAELHEIESWSGASKENQISSVIAIDPPTAPASRTSIGPTKEVVFTFASRIDRKKGLDAANRIIKIAGQEAAFTWRIYGSHTDARYMRELDKQLSQLPRSVSVELLGSYLPESSKSIFSYSSAFLFPTLGENFGHVIAEALAVGCPVIVTPKTPWTDLIDKAGGYIIRSEVEAAKYLVTLANMTPADRLSQRKGVHQAYFDWYQLHQSRSNPFRNVAFP